jgi:hypothetical protein
MDCEGILIKTEETVDNTGTFKSFIAFIIKLDIQCVFIVQV